MIRLYRELLNEFIDKLDDISFEAANTNNFDNNEDHLLTLLLRDDLEKVANKFDYIGWCDNRR